MSKSEAVKTARDYVRKGWYTTVLVLKYGSEYGTSTFEKRGWEVVETISAGNIQNYEPTQEVSK